MASLTGVDIASRFPVMSADAINPSSPGITERMRWSIVSRISSSAAAYRNHIPFDTRAGCNLDGAERVS